MSGRVSVLSGRVCVPSGRVSVRGEAPRDVPAELAAGRGMLPTPGHGDVPQNCKTLSGLKERFKNIEQLRSGTGQKAPGRFPGSSRGTRRISPATTRLERGWEERAGEGVKSCFL